MKKEEIKDLLGILFFIALFLLNGCMESLVDHIDQQKEVKIQKEMIYDNTL